jgi:hypothetical protein
MVKRATGWVSAHVCPVPGCGRHRDEHGYFNLSESRPSSLPEKQNKQAAARAEIMRMIEAIRIKAESDLNSRQQK